LELVYCDIKSSPGRPAHFAALPHKNELESAIFEDEDVLDVVLVLCGTKMITDIVIDDLLQSEDFCGGKAHSDFLTASGAYIADLNLDWLRKKLAADAGKSCLRVKILVTLLVPVRQLLQVCSSGTKTT
jgi:hypothetical protein